VATEFCAGFVLQCGCFVVATYIYCYANNTNVKKQRIPELVEKKKEGGFRYNLHPGQISAWFSPAKYVFLYAGIQSGKCIAHYTKIVTTSGKQKTIKNVARGDEVWSLDESSRKIVPAKVLNRIDSGILHIYRVVTETGRQVDVSETHPFLTEDGWKEIRLIKTGDLIGVYESTSVREAGELLWDKVREIEYFGEEQCYDLEIENHHNFVANDIFVHNTSFLSLLLHREMQRFYLEDGNISLKDKDPDAYEASKQEVVGIDRNSGNFVTKTNAGTYNSNALQATQIGGGDYVAVTATNRLFNDKFMGEIRSLFVDKFNIAKYHDAARLFELRDPRTGKFWATHSKDKMYGRIMLYSAQQKGGVESVTARAAMVDEFGMPSFTLNIWDGITGRLSLTAKEESTGVPSLFPSGRVFGGSIVYYDGGWQRKEIYDRWLAGDKAYKVVHFDSIMNPFFSREEYETKRRTMSTGRFENRYRGRYAITSGMIYSDYDPTIHVVEPFLIPDEWQRYVGIDPGAVHTALVWAARNPDDDVFYVYRATLDGNKTTSQHVASALSYGEHVSFWIGGSPSESQFRMDWTDAGIRVQQPPIKDVEAGIDRIIALFKTNHLRIFKTCTLLLDEITTYSRKLDDMDEPTDVIKDKNRYHELDAARYLFSKLSKPPTNAVPIDKSRFGAKSIPGFGTIHKVPSMGVAVGGGHIPCM